MCVVKGTEFTLTFHSSRVSTGMHASHECVGVFKQLKINIYKQFTIIGIIIIKRR